MSSHHFSSLQSAIIPTAKQFNLRSFQFDDSNLSDDETLFASITMFEELDLVKSFKIDYKVAILMYVMGCCHGDIVTDLVLLVDHSEEELSCCRLSQLETCLQCGTDNVCHHHSMCVPCVTTAASLTCF